MKYKNVKTGAIIDSPFVVRGDNWEEFNNKSVEKSTQEPEKDYVEEEVNLEEMKKAELIDFAKEHEIEINEKEKKEKIIETIAKAFE